MVRTGSVGRARRVGANAAHQGDRTGRAEGTGVPIAGASAATAGLNIRNSAFGVWNPWERQHDSSGRARKWMHAALSAAADAGFVYEATLAHDAQRYGAEARDRHRHIELASMG